MAITYGHATLKEVFLRTFFVNYWVTGEGPDWYVPAIMMFYFLTPLLVQIFNEIKDRKLLLFFFIMTPTLVNVIIDPTYPVNILIITFARISPFILGIALGYAINQHKKIPIAYLGSAE